jgi:ADP-heptose:LPS heptosyltransferase
VNLTQTNRLPDLKTIAIFRALYLGDMLCIIPAVRAVRYAYPETEITLIGLPWQHEFVKRYSRYFNNFIEFPGWPGLPEREPDSKKILQFLNIVRDKRFDLILQMQGNGMETNHMCQLWGAKAVCGLKRDDGRLPKGLFVPSEDNENEIQRFLKLVDVLGIPRKGEHLEFPFFESEIANFEVVQKQLQLENIPYVCLHPGARDPKRRWPLDNFAFIARHLHQRGLKIVLTGSSQERALLSSLENMLQHPAVNIIERMGDVDLGTLACIINNSKLLVSNDTGVSHIASALRTPSVIIFSPHSVMSRWAPLNTVLHKSISHAHANDPEYVLYTVLDHLQNQKEKISAAFR